MNHSVELKLYRSYANNQELVVQGHAFRKYPSADDLYERRGYRHIRSILRLFTIKTISNARIVFRFGDLEVATRTLSDGYFRITLALSTPLKSGWHTYTVTLDDEALGYPPLTRQGELLVPYEGAYSIISDIDDTFLISYSRHLLKKLYVLLAKNVEAREPFDDVVKHYQLLSLAGRTDRPATNESPANTFFFVSSSEWNLYDYILRFTKANGLPKAVLKLKKIKNSLGDFLMTGGGTHEHKERNIQHIIEFYPQLQFILLGDDSQRDPYIYENICKYFPRNIRAVYIRQTPKQKKSAVESVLANIAAMGVETCYFKHSREAIVHSVRAGIISEEDLQNFGKEKALEIPE
ncbi:hypothetical protein GCM10027275_18410 [Rhabdobacter roseus]|uniref:Phosphatidate phosphatase APP1 n=1 Tax=Rhabdobacter roseus TaxID=1655419 RepID=A0A840TK19_9BACT|nr:App1 family protein [Rhabdobacter roseus]MBB5283764.1 phosphatidate phosphatase APP1 [Rhabdobacter roseus]